MSPRVLLLALIVAASATFVVGVALERSSEADHHETSSASSVHREQSESDEHAESATEHAAATTEPDADAELRPLGVDIEAWPFVIAAVFASLALALAGWLRPRHARWLALVAVVMLAFAALDAREVAHQIDVDKNGLAILAAVVAVLHLAAAAVAASMAARSDQPRRRTASAADTMAS